MYRQTGYSAEKKNDQFRDIDGSGLFIRDGALSQLYTIVMRRCGSVRGAIFFMEESYANLDR